MFEEALVIRRELKRLRVGFLGVEVAIARERAVAAVHEEGVAAEVLLAVPPEEAQEHRFVVPEQEHAVVLLLHPQQRLDHTLRIRTTVDVVADEDQPVTIAERQAREQLFEQLALTVDVSDRVEQEPFSPCRGSSALLPECLIPSPRDRPNRVAARLLSRPAPLRVSVERAARRRHRYPHREGAAASPVAPSPRRSAGTGRSPAPKVPATSYPGVGSSGSD